MLYSKKLIYVKTNAKSNLTKIKRCIYINFVSFIILLKLFKIKKYYLI